jgi:[ribosomal protein S18]-alanine N-acetyltransferase
MLRPAAVSDAVAITALDSEVFGPDAWSGSSVEAELAGAGRRTVVAIEAERLVGYAITSRADDVVDLRRIAVRPSHRRQGLAHDLLAACLDRARHERADRVLLEVSADNPAALAFYAVEGFTEIDRRRRYYRDGSDAVVMRLPLAVGCGGPRPERRR